MAEQWTGGFVESTRENAPPSVSEWSPVDVPGWPGRFTDVDGPVAYKLQFSDPRTDPTDTVLLESRGLAHVARVWLNRELVGHHDAYFLPARFDLDPGAENDLIVECRPPEAASGRATRFGGTPGIWWGADLQVHDESFLYDLDVTPSVDPAADEGTLDVSIVVEAHEPLDDHVTISVRPEGFRGGGSMERANVRADAGERVTVTKTIRISSPAYWWPHGYGPQHRYVVRAKLGDHAREVTTGFSTVERSDDGLIVNGTAIRARGFNRLPGGDPVADVEAALDANANLVRAHAHVPRSSFHDACDEAGVLVWQDLPISGPGIDVDRATRLADALETARGHHPSIALFGVHDDPRSPFSPPIGAERFARWRLRWRAWRTSYDRTDADAVAAALPDDRPVIAVSGPLGVDADAVHLYPGWHYLHAESVEWLLERYPSVGTTVGEFGAGALAVDGELGAFEELDADAHATYVGTRNVTISQAYQARTLKIVAEALRRRGCGILAAYALADQVDGGGMGVLAADGSEKVGYEAIAHAFEPIQAMLDAPPWHGATGVTVVNDTPEPVSATLSWTARETDRSIQGGEADEPGTSDEFDEIGSVTVPAHERVDAGSIEISDDADLVELVLTLDEGTVSNRYRLTDGADDHGV